MAFNINNITTGVAQALGIAGAPGRTRDADLADSLSQTNNLSVTPTSPAPTGAAPGTSGLGQSSIPQLTTAAGYKPVEAQTATVTPDSKATVSDQLTGLISQNSPYIQAARTQALQGMNSRGLMNSSMAEGAAASAAIQAALPIAQQDAQTNFQAQTANANSQNANNQFNANSQNQASSFLATAKNQMDVANLDATTRGVLADVEAKYKVQMQSSQSAATMFQQTVSNITAITQDKDMGPEAKKVAIDRQLDMLQGGFQLQTNISGLNLGKILQFDPSAPPATSQVNELTNQVNELRNQVNSQTANPFTFDMNFPSA